MSQYTRPEKEQVLTKEDEGECFQAAEHSQEALGNDCKRAPSIRTHDVSLLPLCIPSAICKFKKIAIACFRYPCMHVQ